MGKQVQQFVLTATVRMHQAYGCLQRVCNCLQDMNRQAYRSLQQSDRGAVTAEYAVVIIAATAFAAVLIAIVKSDAVRTALTELIKRALHVGS